MLNLAEFIIIFLYSFFLIILYIFIFKRLNYLTQKWIKHTEVVWLDLWNKILRKIIFILFLLMLIGSIIIILILL